MKRLSHLIFLSLLTACGPATASPEPTPLAASSTPSPVALPEGFPVLPGARRVAPPDPYPEAIAAWQTDAVGSAPYDFYSDELPARGFQVVGRYPGGGAAIIRFALPGGEVLQVVMEPSPDGGTRIVLRPDRP